MSVSGEFQDDLHMLNDSWTLQFHDPWSADWTFESYDRLGDMCSIEELCMIEKKILPCLHQGIWFLFREHIFPAWDDKANLEGGCMSMKILKQDAQKFWTNLCYKMLGESLLVEKVAHKWSCVNGISISPKKHFCILKIWLGSDEIGDAKFFNIGKDYQGEIFYKSNRDNITNNHVRGAL
jgi:hypothetical protein